MAFGMRTTHSGSFREAMSGLSDMVGETVEDSGGVYLNTNVNPDQLNAKISRQQYEDYVKRFAPIESEYVGSLMDDDYVREGVRSAADRTEQANEIATGVTERSLARGAVTVTPMQRQAIERMRKLGFARNKAGGMNRARVSYDDMQTEAIGNAVSLGRGLATTASGAASNAAGMATARNNANRVADAQHDANMMGLLGTIGMMAMFSSEQYKENIEEVDAEELHRDVQNMRVVRFDYKDDAPAQGKDMVGVIVEELPDRYRVGDDKVNLYNIIHALAASNQVLTRRLEKLEAQRNG